MATFEEKIAIAEKELRAVIKAYTRDGTCSLSENQLREHAFLAAGNAFPNRNYLKPIIDKLLTLVKL